MRLYTDEIVARALEHRKAGWTREQTREHLYREFHLRPAVDTLRSWEDPVYAERRKAWKRTNHMRHYQGYTGRSKGRLVRELYLRGVSLRAIGQVTAVVSGEELTDLQVMRALGLKHGDVVRRMDERQAA